MNTVTVQHITTSHSQMNYKLVYKINHLSQNQPVFTLTLHSDNKEYITIFQYVQTERHVTKRQTMGTLCVVPTQNMLISLQKKRI